jgi:hypothetical protein
MPCIVEIGREHGDLTASATDNFDVADALAVTQRAVQPREIRLQHRIQH